MIPWMFKRAAQRKAFTEALESLISGGEDLGMHLGKGLPRDKHLLAALAQNLMGKGLGAEDAKEVLKLLKQVPEDDIAAALKNEGGLIGMGQHIPAATPNQILGQGGLGGKMINSWTGRPGY